MTDRPGLAPLSWTSRLYFGGTVALGAVFATTGPEDLVRDGFVVGAALTAIDLVGQVTYLALCSRRAFGLVVLASWARRRRRYLWAMGAVTFVAAVGLTAMALPRSGLPPTAVALGCHSLGFLCLTRPAVWFLGSPTFDPQTATSAAYSEMRRHRPGQPAILICEVDAHVREGNHGFALPLLREFLNHPGVDRAGRGPEAARLAWHLLYEHAEDPVPAEARHLTQQAVIEAPQHPTVLIMKAFFEIEDGQPEHAVRSVGEALRKSGHNTTAHVFAVIVNACAEALRGNTASSDALREQVLALDPDNELVAWIDDVRNGVRAQKR